MLLAEREGNIVGFCAHGPANYASVGLTKTWEIYGLHVAPALRGGGIGSTLFSEARECARRAGASQLTLWVVETNTPARRFYEARAMQPDGAEKRRELARGVELHEVRYALALT